MAQEEDAPTAETPPAGTAAAGQPGDRGTAPLHRRTEDRDRSGRGRYRPQEQPSQRRGRVLQTALTATIDTKNGGQSPGPRTIMNDVVVDQAAFAASCVSLAMSNRRRPPITILRGFSASGTTRFRPTCSRPAGRPRLRRRCGRRGRSDAQTRGRRCRDTGFPPSGLIGDPAGHDQRVVLDRHVEVLRTETGHRHGQAIGVVAGLFDVVGRIALRFLAGSGGVHETSQPVKANGGTEKRSKINSRHKKPPAKQGRCCRPPMRASPFGQSRKPHWAFPTPQI